MKFDELKAIAKKDLTLGDELDFEAKDLPRKKAQWSEWLTVEAMTAKGKEIALNKVIKKRFEYYFSGYDLKLDKKEIREVYIPGDDEVVEAQAAYELAKEKVEFAERTLKSLISAGFDIKNVIEYRKLMSGII